MATANALFAQADLNNDERLDLNEFRNIVGAGNLTGLGAGGGGGYSSSSYQSSSYDSSTNGGALGGDLAYVGAGLGSAGYSASSYESSSYNGSADNAAGNLGITEGTVGLAVTDLAASNYATTTQTTTTQQYEADAQGLFKDSNPQIIRRPAQGGILTYTQNIKVRFLQPPTIPPPGPLIIKEVRPPQPPPPPPLRIRQQAPPLPQPPPLILRERPPIPPASAASQTVIRKLAALSVPPRSVIIERLPALPAKPRDIIIERWVPYGAAAKRKTIVQRAAAAQQYLAPRNIIIQYEAAQMRIVRQFQRLGVTQENPAAYVQRYGGSLLDAQSLLQQARAAGVVEDISAPIIAGAVAVGTAGGAADLNAGIGGASSYESSSYSATTDGSGLSAGFGAAGLQGASAYESASYSANTDAPGLGVGLGGGSAYESSSYSSSTGTTFGGASDAAFAAADLNQDGVLSQGEFRTAGY